MTPLYALEDGTPVSTHSMLKCFRRCPRQAYYKFVLRLKPRLVGVPLKRGKWIHSLLEHHYSGRDWMDEHKRLASIYAEMLDEEKDFYGDMPKDILRIMQSYFWHYEEDPWKVLDTEITLECPFPDGTIYRCRLDVFVEDNYGLWIGDHKSHKTLPNLDFRLLDAQSALYLWAAAKNDIEVQGFIWNYLRTKAPTIPEVLKDGSRLSARKIETDYPTLLRAIKRAELNPRDYKDALLALKADRYRPGEPQTSPFFRRDHLEKSQDLIKRVVQENYRTSRRMHKYFSRERQDIERCTSRSCSFDCSYMDLCTIDLFGGNTTPVIKQKYKVGDPMSYYQDPEDTEGIEEV